MRRIRSTVAGSVLAGVLTLTGCGVEPSGVIDQGQAPTGVAPGVTLYFIDADGELQPQLRETGRLGTIAEVLNLLLLGPGDSDLRTEISSTGTTRVEVTTNDDVIELRVPLAARDVTSLGIDQIVCTALGVYVRGGGSTSATVRIEFTLPTPESDQRRTCPVIG